MTTQITLPSDPLSRFRDIYAALNAERSWFQGASPLRFAAMSAMPCPGDARGIGWCGRPRCRSTLSIDKGLKIIARTWRFPPQ